MKLDKNRFLCELEEKRQVSQNGISFEAQTEPQKVFTAIWEVEGRVNGDGFDGWLRYTEPASRMYAPAALRAIGAQQCAEIVQSAIDLILPRAKDDDWDSLLTDLDDESLDERLEELDQQFYEYPDNLTDLLFDYVSRHPESFGEVPQETPEKRSFWQKLFGKR